MKVLCGLLVSGNMPNLMTAGSQPPVSSSSATPESSSSSELPTSSSSDAQSLVAHVAAAPALSVNGRVLQVNYAGYARIDLFSVTGSVVRTLANGRIGASTIRLENIPSGVYVVRVQTANATVMKKIRLQ